MYDRKNKVSFSEEAVAIHASFDVCKGTCKSLNQSTINLPLSCSSRIRKSWKSFWDWAGAISYRRDTYIQTVLPDNNLQQKAGNKDLFSNYCQQHTEFYFRTNGCGKRSLIIYITSVWCLDIINECDRYTVNFECKLRDSSLSHCLEQVFRSDGE